MLSPRWVGREQVFLRVYSVWNAEAAAERARRRRVGVGVCMLGVEFFFWVRWGLDSNGWGRGGKCAMQCDGVVGEMLERSRWLKVLGGD